jgi:hypothetical protein
VAKRIYPGKNKKPPLRIVNAPTYTPITTTLAPFIGFVLLEGSLALTTAFYAIVFHNPQTERWLIFAIQATVATAVYLILIWFVTRRIRNCNSSKTLSVSLYMGTAFLLLCAFFCHMFWSQGY